MSPLATLQRDFQRHILAGGRRIRSHVVDTAQASADVRLGVYADAYRLRLLEALEADYPGLKALAGDELFEELGTRYIRKHPSSFTNVRWYGHRLAEFLAGTRPYSRHPVLAEMAAFEWAMTLAFDSPDDAAVGVAEVAALPPQSWPDLVCRPHPSLQRLRLRWNVPAFWKAVNEEIAPEAPQALPEPVEWLIWRSGLAVYFRSLDAVEAWALDAMAEGQSFGEVCQGLAQWLDEGLVAQHAAGLLRRWVQDGLVGGLSVRA